MTRHCGRHLHRISLEHKPPNNALHPTPVCPFCLSCSRLHRRRVSLVVRSLGGRLPCYRGKRMWNERLSHLSGTRKQYLWWSSFLVASCILLYHYTHFSRLEIKSLTYHERNIRFAGTTDLPDNTILVVAVNWAHLNLTRPAADMNIKVMHHRFAGQENLPPDVPNDPSIYTLEVLCSPVVQWETRNKIGDRGQNLIGKQSYRSNGMNFLSVKCGIAQQAALSQPPK